MKIQEKRFLFVHFVHSQIKGRFLKDRAHFRVETDF